MTQEHGEKKAGWGRALRRVLRVGVFVVSGALIVSALVFSVARMVLPMMTEYRYALEQELTQQWGKPVHFDRFDLSWSGYRPQLIIDHIQLTDGPRIRRLAVSLAPLTSLVRRRLSAGEIEIDQPSFSLEQDGAGHWRLGGYVAKGNGGTGMDAAHLRTLLKQMGQVSIRDARIRIVNAVGDVHEARLNVAARIESNDWSASGNVDVPDVMPVPARLRATGRFGDDSNAQVFLSVHDWRLSPVQSLLRAYTVGGTRTMLGGCEDAGQNADCLRGVPRIDSGRLTGELWLGWEKGRLNSVQTMAQVQNLAVTRLVHGEVPSAQAGISHLSTRIAWHNIAPSDGSPGGWRLDGDRLDVVTTNGVRWPTQSFHVIRRGRQTEFSAGYADLNQLAVWLATAPLPESYLRLLGNNEPRGQARDVRLAFDGDHLERGYLHLENFGNATGRRLWPVVGKADGTGGINLTLYKQPSGWLARIDQNQLDLAVPGMFREPIHINHLAGDIYWRDQGEMVLWSDGLAFDNADMQTQSRFLFRTEGAPLLQIHTDFSQVPINRVPSYLPRHVLGGGVLGWLDRAIGNASGTATKGTFVFNGHPGKFPFEQGEGQFAVRFHFTGLNLPYLKDWPALQDGAGDARFVNSGMAIDLQHGHVDGVKVDGGGMSIDDYAHPRVHLVLNSRNPLARYLDFLGDSPLLSKSVVGAFRADGDADLNLDLSIPLDKDAQKRADHGVVAKGTVDLDGSRLRWKGTPVTLEDIKGQLAFLNDQINADKLTARFDGAPATLAVKTKGRGAPTTVSARVALDPLFYLRGSKDSAMTPWLSAMSGKSDARITATIPHRGSDFSLDVQSDLTGVTSNLPEPLGKSTSQPMPTSLDMNWRAGKLRGLSLETHRSNGFEGRLHYRAVPKGEAQPWQAQIKSDRFDWTDWSDRLKSGSGVVSGGTTAWPGLSLQFDVTHFLVAGRDFGRTSARVLHRLHDESVDVDLDGGRLAGDLSLTRAVKTGAPLKIAARFQRLYLAGDTAKAAMQPKSTPDNWPLQDMPDLSLRIADLRYGKEHLGQLTLRAAPGQKSGVPAWLITALQWQPSKSVSVQGSGGVQGNGKHQQSWLDLTGKGEDLGSALTQVFGSSPIQKGRIRTATAKLYGAGPLTALSLKTASGQGRFVIEKGRLMDVDTGAARLAGLFSLGGLLRRLQLDFRDVFENGLAFDSLAAKWKLNRGALTFDPLELKNPSMAAIVSGKTDLARQTLNLRVDVYADVGMLLPIIGTVAGGPVVGGAILALQEVMKSVNKNPEPSVVYRVTGTYDKPKIEKVKATDADRKAGNLPG